MSEGASETVATAELERARQLAADADRVLVKIGTNSLTDDDSNLDNTKLDKLVDDVEDLLGRGKEVILVSSAAIVSGIGRVGLDHNDRTVEEAQALSTVGQSHLMHRYNASFARHDRTVAQLLLTEHDLENPERFTNFHNAIETLLDWGIVPIINENDAVATQEIEIGDNDMLSASIAIGVGVDLLVMLTDVDGVYTGNPKHDAAAERIEAVGRNYAAVEDVISRSADAEFGGIRTKVEGARDASEHGIPAVIAGSAEPDVLDRIATAKPVGTLFVPVNGATDD
ncbi:glutamate 5-kinase [Haloglomus irregulare]|jgi:glutamate 5-kinase|uniref:Glutamate 5-kinase n=1 Tax=Haloglomus irregulare TaxID=2234134 RepID=A0A554NAS7_9EURY|nr:glutamate 5-kinase [Haloglomus irregulare]TSD14070.1 glutamate 5-kinase [Haloglomus irregulare]